MWVLGVGDRRLPSEEPEDALGAGFGELVLVRRLADAAHRGVETTEVKKEQGERPGSEGGLAGGAGDEVHPRDVEDADEDDARQQPEAGEEGPPDA